MPDFIVFEQPLNERVRTLIRLHHLFREADHHAAGASAWDTRAALAGLTEALELLTRSDVKTEFLKELERVQAVLSPLAARPGVDDSRLTGILTALERCSEAMHAARGQLGQGLRDNEFLAPLRQRSAIPGGATHMDLPAYHYWLQGPPEAREADLRAWLGELDLIREPVDLLLDLLRQSADWSAQCAPRGVYQKSLDPEAGYQLVRVRVARADGCFAEISGGKHRFTVRFMEFSDRERPRQRPEDVEFELSCCAL